MKAIVLTHAPITKKEQELLKNTDIFKIACNNYCAELNPNLRLCADDIVDKCLICDNCPVISLNYDFNKTGVINGSYLPNRHTTLVSCVDYLYLKGFTSILLVASNPDSATYKLNIEGINSIKDCLYLYKYSENCNLDIPYKSIKDFIMMTEEDKLLGNNENSEKVLLKKLIFTSAYKYEVHTKDRDNKSVESGEIINNILPVNKKEELLQGAEEIEYNGLVIKRLTGIKAKEEPKKEVEEIKEPVKKTVRKKK